MLRTLLYCGAAAALGLAMQLRGDDGTLSAGVPLELAQERAARLKDVRYELHFTIPSEPTEPIMGRAVMRFHLGGAGRPLVLDFAGPLDGFAASVSGTPIEVGLASEHIVVPAAALREGENAIEMRFTAGDAPLNRHPEFMYALFVPARARLAFPCVDQPDVKAKYRLTLDVPDGWEALSNGAEASRAENGGRERLQFEETKPLPTYLFTFAAGRFQVETAERGGRRFRMLHRETDAEKVARNRDVIFDLHASALAWLEDYTAVPYPWGKFDFLLVPSFQFGGMEHAGAIFYNASALLLDPSATVNQKLGRASLIAHETAHMWFGDLVTMRWFDDVWTKEVFANFMAAKIVNPSFPEINHELRFLLAHYPAAYEVDRTPGTNAIRQQLVNLNEAGSLYGAIIYQKAPIVMRQLEAILGAERLRDGLREYLRNHAFGNASWPDLIALLDRRTADDLAAWSRAWVDERGRPRITTELRVGRGNVDALILRQHDPIAARGLAWSQRLQVAVALEDGVRSLPVTMRGARVDVEAARGLPAPRFVLPTGGGVGYGGFELDPASRRYLLAHLEDVPDALTRGSAVVTLWEEMLNRHATPHAVLDMLVRALPREQDELNVQQMLSYAEQAYWRYLTSDERAKRAPHIERVLRSGLDAASTQSRKSAWFGALRDTALTRETLEWLERVWRQEEQVAGLELAEPDYISLAQQLALRVVPGWNAILEQQHERILNPDRRARFVYVRPALSADPEVRDAFFESLKDAANRRREAWVLEAVGFLHHPLRAASAERYILASLTLLREIQRTGDIFFPKRWMDATLSGHSSAKASDTVEQFVASLPQDYPDRLRRVILSSADHLFRAARSR